MGPTILLIGLQFTSYMIHDQTVHEVVSADQLSIAQLVLNVIGSQLREGGWLVERPDPDLTCCLRVCC